MAALTRTIPVAIPGIGTGFPDYPQEIPAKLVKKLKPRNV